jgi:hypothetical protein
MIMRRADRLAAGDNVRLDDGRLWNVEATMRIVSAQDITKKVTVQFSRTAGDQMTLDLWPDDLVLLA